MNAQDFITAGQNNIQMLLKTQQVGGALVSNAMSEHADALLKLKELQVRQDEAANERELRKEQFKTEQKRLEVSHKDSLAVQRDSQKISLGNLALLRDKEKNDIAASAIDSQLKLANATTQADRVRTAAATTIFKTKLVPLEERRAALQATLQRAGAMDAPGQPAAISMLNRLGGSVPPAAVSTAKQQLKEVEARIEALNTNQANVEAASANRIADTLDRFEDVVKNSVVNITPLEPLPVLSGNDYTTGTPAGEPDLPTDGGGETQNILLPPNGPPTGAEGNSGATGPTGSSSNTARAPRAVIEEFGNFTGVVDKDGLTDLIGLEPFATQEEEAAAQASALPGTLGVVLPPGMKAVALVKQNQPWLFGDSTSIMSSPVSALGQSQGDTAMPDAATAPAAPAESAPPPPPVKYAGDFTRFKAHEHAQYHKDLALYEARASSAADTSEEGKIERAQAMQIASQLKANVDKILIDEQELPTTLRTLASEAGIFSPQMAYLMASRSENPVVEMGKLQGEAYKAAVQMVSKSNLPTMQKNQLLQTYPKAVFDAYQGAFSKDGLVQPAEGFKDPITKTNISIEEVAVRDAFGATAADGKTPWRGYVEPDLGPPANAKPATVDVADIFGVKKPVSGNRKPLVETRKDAAAQVGDADVSESPAPFGAAIKRDWWDGNTLSDEGEAQYRSALAEKVKDFSIPKIVERVRDLSADLGPKSPAISIPWESTRAGVEFSGTFGGMSGIAGGPRSLALIQGAPGASKVISPQSLSYLEALTAKAMSDTPEAPEAKAVLIDLWTSLASRYAERKLEK